MNFQPSLNWRIALTNAALIFLALAVPTFFLTGMLRDRFATAWEQRLEQQAQLVSATFSPYLDPSALTLPAKTANLQDLSRELEQVVNAHITIISIDGAVLADSRQSPESPPGNYSILPEVRQALAGDLGRSSRNDPAGSEVMFYTAVPIWNNGAVIGAVRLGEPASRAEYNLGPIFIPLALWALAVGCLSMALGYLTTRRTSQAVHLVTEGSQRLGDGELDYRVQSYAPGEIHELADAFNRMADSVRGVIRNLSAERNTLSAVLDTMADGVIVTEPSGQVMLLNPAARGLLGIGGQQAEGSRLIELVRDHEIHRLVSQCQADKVRLQQEVALLYPRRYISAIATPLDETSARGVLLTLHDLTRIRQVEISQREFVSNVSHELRNPMASIKAIVETLELGAMEDPKIAADFLSRMLRDVDRINNLVDDLLELSRMESGQFIIDAEPTSLPPLVQAVRRQFRETAEAREVTIDTGVPDNLPLIMADGDKLNQILVNLVENALKFTQPQGRIAIEAQPTPGWMEIRVKDTGIGVAPQHLPHLFERFYKADRSRRDVGTGLGLAIVKQLVEAHGGRITVESREGEGCNFTFTMPQAT